MLPKSLQKLIDSLARLPGVGKKSAQRLAYFLLRSHRDLAQDLGESLLHMRDTVALCRECFMLSDTDVCGICADSRRDRRVICVVEHVFDAEAIERSGEYRGLYHILHGRISPLDNVGPEDIKILELVSRIQKSESSKNGDGNTLLEIIIATNPSSEGETTAFYIHRLLKPLGIKLTRIATGIPMGADLEYADEITLARAMKGRQNYE